MTAMRPEEFHRCFSGRNRADLNAQIVFILINFAGDQREGYLEQAEAFRKASEKGGQLEGIAWTLIESVVTNCSGT